MSNEVQTIVIGNGQAGLAVGYRLATRRVPFQIPDASKRTRVFGSARVQESLYAHA